MRRRTVLRTLGTGTLAFGTGCLGLGGEVVVSVQRSVSVPAGEGWVTEIPDVSDPGGAISYVVRSNDKPFDVYVFQEEAYRRYDAFIKGNDPDRTPAGHPGLSKAAVETGGDGETVYEAQTKGEGARESLDVEGPYYFVVDHSDYRMENRVDDHARPLSAFVDLEVVRRRIGL